MISGFSNWCGAWDFRSLLVDVLGRTDARFLGSDQLPSAVSKNKGSRAPRYDLALISSNSFTIGKKGNIFKYAHLHFVRLHGLNLKCSRPDCGEAVALVHNLARPTDKQMSSAQSWSSALISFSFHARSSCRSIASTACAARVSIEWLTCRSVSCVATRAASTISAGFMRRCYAVARKQQTSTRVGPGILLNLSSVLSSPRTHRANGEQRSRFCACGWLQSIVWKLHVSYTPSLLPAETYRGRLRTPCSPDLG
jgi:hypothetical protein